MERDEKIQAAKDKAIEYHPMEGYVCPKCKRYNAMLYNWEYGEGFLVCRDCGVVVKVK